MTANDHLNGYRVAITRNGYLSPERERELGKRILRARESGSKDREACNEIVEHHLGLAAAEAFKRARPGSDHFHDLMQEGMLALMTAAAAFDYREARFCTYAVWWVWESVYRANLKSKCVHIPEYQLKRALKVARRRDELERKFGREPTASEIAEASDLTVRQVETLLRVLNVQVVSFDDPSTHYEDDGSTIGDMLADGSRLAPDQCVEIGEDYRTILSRLEAILTALPAHHQKMFRLRFGLGESSEFLTLEESAAACGVSKERVRQIIVKILSRLDDELSPSLGNPVARIQRLFDLEDLVAAHQ